MTESKIEISVFKENEQIEMISWKADDSPSAKAEDAKAMILAFWDAQSKNSMRIDLWTKGMTVDDMNDFFFQTFLSMADTYKNATGDENLMAEIKIFAQQFADKAYKAEQKRQGLA